MHLRASATVFGVLGLIISQPAMAQGIALFGDARLGLGYNIDNAGEATGEDDVRAVSRVRFGVNMTGETDSGITFGATIRADNAAGGEGGSGWASGQRSGSVFVSGSFGTLTYGDTNGADEQWVGDVPGDFSLTGLGELDETKFISNGGDFGNDTGSNFAANPEARPTVRYDFDIAGFGISASTNRDLTDIGVGLGYAADFGGGSWTAGIGYNNFDSFVDVANLQEVPDGEQWSIGLGADYDAFAFGVTYINLNSNTASAGKVEADNLLVGASYTFDAWSVGAVYGKILSADGEGAWADFETLDGSDSFELSAQYDLGGGATLNGGVRRTYDLIGTVDDDAAWVGDFGIAMSF